MSISTFSSAVNLGIGSNSQVEDPNAQYEFNTVFNALNILNSFLQNATGITCVTDTNIEPGQLVSLYNNAGTLTARLASATDTTRPAMGFCSSAATPTLGITSITIQCIGLNGYLAALTLGSIYYLSTVPGEITAVPPISSGNIVQPVGIAVDDNTLSYAQNYSYTVVP